MAGLIAIIAGIALIIYAVQHDKKSVETKWLKDWGFWIITILILISGVFSLGDNSPSSVFTVFMVLALLGFLYWRISDSRKKNIHGKKRVPHVLVTILSVFIWVCLLGFISSSLQSNDTNNSTDQDSSTSSNKYIRLDGNKIYYKDSKKYTVDEDADTSWSAAEAQVENVTIYKTEKGYDYGTKRGRKSIQGILAVKVKVKALKDIQVLMDSATISIPSINEQHDIETKDDWDDIDEGISKTGILYVPIYKLHDVNNIKSIRLKFDCEQQDTDEDDFDHTYDMSIDLN